LINTWKSNGYKAPGAAPLPSLIGRLKERYRARERILLISFLGLITFFFIADAFCTNLRAVGRRYLGVTFIDVGQGSSTLLRFPGGGVMLVDGGGFYDRTFDLGRYVVGPYLWHEKIKKIDIMVLTHPDQDHVGGLPFLAENFKIGEFWSNGQESENESHRKLLEIVRERDIPHRIINAGTLERTVGGVSVRILNPQQSLPGCDRRFSFSGYNDNGIVMKITLGRRSILLPADISGLVEERLIASGHDLTADILMAPHHGGHTSSTIPFLRAVRPKVAIISCGPDNTFGFPRPDVLDRYSRAGVRILRTDRDGAVIVRTDGETLDVIRPR
jgi:competence protein ComEC